MALDADRSGEFGVLETFLSHLRARKAAALIPKRLTRGRILDIGCGTRGLLLGRVDFGWKCGLDRRDVPPPTGARFVGADIGSSGSLLPFVDGSYDAVTMLAVIEHIDADRAPMLVSEARRVLRDAGVLILTTPAGWTDPLLDAMAKVRLLSPREIDEHEQTYTREGLTSLLVRGGFDEASIRVGHFELGANLWAVADRTG